MASLDSVLRSLPGSNLRATVHHLHLSTMGNNQGHKIIHRTLYLLSFVVTTYLRGILVERSRMYFLSLVNLINSLRYYYYLLLL